MKSLQQQQQPEPDYEVIEYRGGVGSQPQQEYSNTPPMLPQKQVIGGAKGRSGHCDLCGAVGPRVKCDKCAQQIFCLSCDDMYHRHPKRQSHVRKVRQRKRQNTFIFSQCISDILGFMNGFC